MTKKPNGKIALVTGAAGFIGSHVVEELLAEGFQVWGLDNLSTGDLANLEAVEKNANFSYISGDVRSFDFNMIDRVDVVYHLAALARIQPSIENPVEAHAVNLTGTLNVLEYCRQSKAKIIFSSSSSLYEGSILPSNESSRFDCKSPYALQKKMSEEYIRLFHRLYGVEYTIFRYFNVYGERQILTGAYSAVVGILLDAKQKGKKLPITNDGEQRRDFTYVKDVARANVMAAEWPNSTYKIGTGKNYSVNELADMVGGEKEYIGERIGEARQTLADISRAESKYWKPTMDIKDWIHAQVQG